MRAIFVIVAVLLLWLADSPLLTLGALYLAGAAWLAFECWRAPIVDEQRGVIIAASKESQISLVSSGARSEDRKLA